MGHIQPRFAMRIEYCESGMATVFGFNMPAEISAAMYAKLLAAIGRLLRDPPELQGFKVTGRSDDGWVMEGNDTTIHCSYSTSPLCTVLSLPLSRVKTFASAGVEIIVEGKHVNRVLRIYACRALTKRAPLKSLNPIRGKLLIKKRTLELVLRKHPYMAVTPPSEGLSLASLESELNPLTAPLFLLYRSPGSRRLFAVSLKNANRAQVARALRCGSIEDLIDALSGDGGVHVIANPDVEDVEPVELEDIRAYLAFYDGDGAPIIVIRRGERVVTIDGNIGLSAYVDRGGELRMALPASLPLRPMIAPMSYAYDAGEDVIWLLTHRRFEPDPGADVPEHCYDFDPTLTDDPLLDCYVSGALAVGRLLSFAYRWARYGVVSFLSERHDPEDSRLAALVRISDALADAIMRGYVIESDDLVVIPEMHDMYKKPDGSIFVCHNGWHRYDVFGGHPLSVRTALALMLDKILLGIDEKIGSYCGAIPAEGEGSADIDEHDMDAGSRDELLRRAVQLDEEGRLSDRVLALVAAAVLTY